MPVGAVGFPRHRITAASSWNHHRIKFEDKKRLRCQTLPPQRDTQEQILAQAWTAAQ
jgi:hypothetical protein